MSHRTAMLSFIILVVTAGHVMSQPLPATWAQEESSDLHSNRLALPALSLDETLRAAADTHPSVALKLAEQSSSEYGLEGARWQRWPGMSLSSSRGPFGNTLTEVQLEQRLWTGGRITANVNAAQARLEAARSSVAEAKQLIVERAVTAFADAMRLQDRLAGAQAAIADYEQLTAMIDRRVAGGVSPQNDGTTVRARLQQARSEQLQMRLQLNNARTELEVLIGRRFGELVPPPIPRLGMATLDEALEATLASAPQLGRLSAEERAAEEAIAATRSNLSPAVSIRYNKLFGGGTLYASDQVFVGVSFQPGSGLSSLSAISEAESRRTGAIYSRENARRDLIDRVRSLWNLAESSHNEIAVLQDLVRSTQQVYESCLRQFPVGRRTWLEVLLARRDATQAQYALSDARWTGFASVLKLELATGQLAVRNFRPHYESAE